MASATDNILLSVRDLKTWFGSGASVVKAVDGVSFDIRRGETFALLGESGCGKSMTALSLMQLVPAPAGQIVAGSARFDDTDLLQLSELEMRKVRGKRIAMIFQEPMTSLNPVLPVGEQIAEVLRQHGSRLESASKLSKRIIELLEQVGIPDPAQRINDYPHQLSGGMKQRVMIAIALAAEPDLLIADEPTTALDVTIQAQVLELLKELQQQTGMAILLITHDLGIVSDHVDHVAVMYAGQIVEQASREDFFQAPCHPYTRKLFAALPDRNKRGQSLEVIEGSVPALNRDFKGCRFAERCDVVWPLCHEQKPRWLTLPDSKAHGVRCHRYDARIEFKPEIALQGKGASKITSAKLSQQPTPVLVADDLKVHFPVRKGLFKRTVGYVKAVDGVSLSLRKGQTLALVGESGCGKTTVGKALLQLIRPTSGRVNFQQQELTRLRGEALRQQRSELQIIFQDPFSSMNPRMMVGNILEEGMVAQGIGKNGVERQQRIDSLLQQVGLSTEAKTRYPHEFSGGQRQRICIARALAVEPALIVCDEPTSALDVSVQAQILNLLKNLQSELHLSYLFISHNLSVVEYLAHEVAVMYLGRIVERGPVDKIMSSPKHPYTQALLSAIPVIDKQSKREIIRLQGELPSPIKPPQGCHFHPRCGQAMPHCQQRYPELTRLDDDHEVSCFLYQ